MHRRGLGLLLVTAGLTVGAVAYAVLTLPEPGDLRRPVVPFAKWAEQQSLPTQAMAEQCATANQSAEDRTWCFRQQIAEAQRRWRRSSATITDAWTASELSVTRDLYLVVGAYILFVLAIGGLTVKVVTRLV